jgi:hypothetical protein
VHIRPQACGPAALDSPPRRRNHWSAVNEDLEGTQTENEDLGRAICVWPRVKLSELLQVDAADIPLARQLDEPGPFPGRNGATGFPGCDCRVGQSSRKADGGGAAELLDQFRNRSHRAGTLRAMRSRVNAACVTRFAKIGPWIRIRPPADCAGPGNVTANMRPRLMRLAHSVGWFQRTLDTKMATVIQAALPRSVMAVPTMCAGNGCWTAMGCR